VKPVNCIRDDANPVERGVRDAFHVYGALTQRRNRQLNHVHKVEQIAQEPPVLNSVIQTSVGRGKDPDIDRPVVAVTHSTDLTLFGARGTFCRAKRCGAGMGVGRQVRRCDRAAVVRLEHAERCRARGMQQAISYLFPTV
jgi:hypothetical protein